MVSSSVDSDLLLWFRDFIREIKAIRAKGGNVDAWPNAVHAASLNMPTAINTSDLVADEDVLAATRHANSNTFSPAGSLPLSPMLRKRDFVDSGSTEVMSRESTSPVQSTMRGPTMPPSNGSCVPPTLFTTHPATSSSNKEHRGRGKQYFSEVQTPPTSTLLPQGEHQRTRLSNGLKMLDRDSLEFHMEKAVRLVFELIKENVKGRRSHTISRAESRSASLMQEMKAQASRRVSNSTATSPMTKDKHGHESFRCFEAFPEGHNDQPAVEVDSSGRPFAFRTSVLSLPEDDLSSPAVASLAGGESDFNLNFEILGDPNGPQIVLSNSMDVDELLGSQSLQNVDPFTEHTNLRQEVDNDGNRIINDHVVIRHIGNGAFGVVKLAHRRDDPKKLVAIKIINKSLRKRTSLSAFGSDTESQIRREIAIMKKLRHKNIVTLHAVVDDPEADKLYLIMDYIGEGQLLKPEKDPELVEHGFIYEALPEQTVKHYLRQLVDGLRYLHKHDIVHRDIKPANILVGGGDRIFISDFGVSDIVASEAALEEDFGETSPGASLTAAPSPQGDGGGSKSFTVAGTKGTPLFWPPEMFAQSDANLHDGESQDLWALGITLFMMLTGRPPFIAESFSQLRRKVMSTDDLDVPKDLSLNAQFLLRAMLNKDPKKRLSLLDIRNHPFLGGVDKRSAMARGSVLVVAPDESEEEHAIATASNALPFIRLFLFKIKPKLRRFLNRVRERIAERKHQQAVSIASALLGTGLAGRENPTPRPTNAEGATRRPSAQPPEALTPPRRPSDASTNSFKRSSTLLGLTTSPSTSVVENPNSANAAQHLTSHTSQKKHNTSLVSETTPSTVTNNSLQNSHRAAHNASLDATRSTQHDSSQTGGTATGATTALSSPPLGAQAPPTLRGFYILGGDCPSGNDERVPHLMALGPQTAPSLLNQSLSGSESHSLSHRADAATAVGGGDSSSSPRSTLQRSESKLQLWMGSQSEANSPVGVYATALQRVSSKHSLSPSRSPVPLQRSVGTFNNGDRARPAPAGGPLPSPLPVHRRSHSIEILRSDTAPRLSPTGHLPHQNTSCQQHGYCLGRPSPVRGLSLPALSAPRQLDGSQNSPYSVSRSSEGSPTCRLRSKLSDALSKSDR